VQLLGARNHVASDKAMEKLLAQLAPPPPAASPEPSPPTTSAEPSKAPRRARAARPTAAPRTTPIEASAREWPPPPPPPPRPLDDDATFFLRETSVPWPCAPEALQAAWAQLSTRLRRMAPASASAAAFARASRGYESLRRAAA
jgi:hypothetical protein